ncbi:MAG: hypothetical protein AAF938_16200 [Myxococcota bacterium]
MHGLSGGLIDDHAVGVFVADEKGEMGVRDGDDVELDFLNFDGLARDEARAFFGAPAIDAHVALGDQHLASGTGQSGITAAQEDVQAEAVFGIFDP